MSTMEDIMIKQEFGEDLEVSVNVVCNGQEAEALENGMVIKQEKECNESEDEQRALPNVPLIVPEDCVMTVKQEIESSDEDPDPDTVHSGGDDNYAKEGDQCNDDLFCIDGITNSKEKQDGLGKLWDSANILSLPKDFIEDSDSSPFKCPICSKRFLTKARLNKHSLTHSEEVFECSFCNFTTKRKDYLRVHEMNHLETKMFKCLKCKFGTNVRSRLRIHESSHAVEKLFKCSKCKYKTTRKDNLKLHELNHLEVKRFHCDHCDYASNNKRNLKDHMLNHLNLRLFKCPECSYETNKKNNLKMHQGRHGNNSLGRKSQLM